MWLLLALLSVTIYQPAQPDSVMGALLEQILYADDACTLGADITSLYPELDSKSAWYQWNEDNWPYKRPARLYFIDGVFQLYGRGVNDPQRLLALQLPEQRRDFWLIHDEETNQWIYLEFVQRVFREPDGQGDHCYCIRVLNASA
jgi:hypothetical protein